MANRKIKAELEIDGKDNTSAAFRSVAKNVGNVEKRLAQFNKQAAAFNRTSAEFSKRAAAVDRAGAAVAKRHVAVGRASEEMALVASRYLGPAVLGAGFVYSVKQAANFEESLSNIQKKAGATGEQMQKMRGELMDLGHVMPVSMDEIAKGFERGAAAGIPLGELKEFAALSVKVADAWDVSAEQSANFFSGFNASLHIKYGKDMKDYASLINDLGDSGIADEKDIADFVDRFGGSGINFGLTAQEIAAVGASMLDLKMPADVGSRAMSTLTSALLAPENLSKKAHNGLKSIVGDVGAFSKLSGNQKLTTFIDKLKDMSGQRQTSLLGALLGQGFSDEITRLVAGSETFAQNMALAHKETVQASNSVDRVYEQRLKLFNSQIDLLKNNVDQLAVRIGNVALPPLTDALISANQHASDSDAQEKAQAGMSWQQRRAQGLDYDKRWNEVNPSKTPRDRQTADVRRLTDYNKDLASLGRGEIQDLFDNLAKRQKQNFMNEHYTSWPDEALRRFPANNDLPTVDHGYSIRNLPKVGPVPAGRPAPPSDGNRQMYGEGQQILRDVQTYSPEVNHSNDMLRQLMEKYDGGGLKDGADQAGRTIEESGSKAGEALGKTAADHISAAGADSGTAFAKAVADVLLSIIEKIPKSIQVNTTQSGPHRGSDFNPGYNMPPSVTSPNNGGGGW